MRLLRSVRWRLWRRVDIACHSWAARSLALAPGAQRLDERLGQLVGRKSPLQQHIVPLKHALVKRLIEGPPALSLSLYFLLLFFASRAKKEQQKNRKYLIRQAIGQTSPAP